MVEGTRSRWPLLEEFPSGLYPSGCVGGKVRIAGGLYRLDTVKMELVG
jgi:hypothetical protein